jgi:hypothetical protein
LAQFVTHYPDPRRRLRADDGATHRIEDRRARGDCVAAGFFTDEQLRERAEQIMMMMTPGYGGCLLGLLDRGL